MKEKKEKKVKSLSNDQLKKEVETLKKDLFNFRFRKVNGQLENPAKVSEIKKQVARALTKMNGKA